MDLSVNILDQFNRFNYSIFNSISDNSEISDEKSESFIIHKDEYIRNEQTTNYITFDMNKKETKLFEISKKGRRKKNQKNNNLKLKRHDKFSLNNAIRKIIHSCNQSIYDFIKTKLHKNQKINRPTIEKQIGTKIKDYRLFFKKTYAMILYKTIPKRYKKQKIKNEKKELTIEDKEKIYETNKKNLDKILEKNNQKILFELFNLTFGDFFKAYLNDSKDIYINDTYINLEGFKTYGQCFNTGTNSYSIRQKEKYKVKLLNNYLK